MAATENAKQALWLQELLEEITDKEANKAVIRTYNKSVTIHTKNPVFMEEVNTNTRNVILLENLLKKVLWTLISSLARNRRPTYDIN